MRGWMTLQVRSRNITNTRAAGLYENALESVLAASQPSKLDQIKKATAVEVSDFEKETEKLSQVVDSDEDRREVAVIRAALVKWKGAYEHLQTALDRGNVKEAMTLLEQEVKPLSDEMVKTAKGLANAQYAEMNESKRTAAASYASNRVVTLLAILFSLLAALAMGWVVRGVNHSLRQTAAELSEGAAQTASAATQVSSSSQSLAQGSSEQSASLEETASSSEEINSMAHKNTANSRQAADLVSQSQQKFVETNQALEEMVGAMAEINASSDRISKIIKVIDEIAFQTNILALNAAVEAARAGEAGMGFAVVADEVRNLAQRCAQAAKDTATLIEESIGKSNDGKAKVDHVTTAIRTITGESMKVKTLVEEVNLGSQEQARGTEQISKAIMQMQQVTQQTAANAEESAAAAEQLTAQSETLKAVVERLGSMVGA